MATDIPDAGAGVATDGLSATKSLMGDGPQDWEDWRAFFGAGGGGLKGSGSGMGSQYMGMGSTELGGCAAETDVEPDGLSFTKSLVGDRQHD